MGGTVKRLDNVALATAWVKRLNEERDQKMARRALSDRFETCDGNPVRDGKHSWVRFNTWHQSCNYCNTIREIIE
jgi:hypothetical protein